MPTFDTFSKRIRRAQNQGKPILYQYDELSQQLRVQIVRILDRTIGNYSQYDGYSTHPFTTPATAWWDSLQKIMADELGVFSLTGKADQKDAQCRSLILAGSTEEVIDITEVAFKIINTLIRTQSRSASEGARVQQDPDDAIGELNQRFQEHAVGYQFAGNEIIRIDSQLLHAKVVEPALQLLHDARFTTASEEFLKAHENYRKGNTEDALVWCLKAFESTMKIICDDRGWIYDSRAQAKDLIKVVLDNGLVKTYMQEQLTGLRISLESGVPTIRNKEGGHGQGNTPRTVPPYLTSYTVHLTAANIVLLVEAYHAL